MQPFQGQRRSSGVHNASELRCVQCGHPLAEDLYHRRIQETSACRQCGCDLIERPPMSYARMEGFLGKHTLADYEEPAAQETWEHCLQGRLTERWIACTFFGTIILILLIGFLRN